MLRSFGIRDPRSWDPKWILGHFLRILLTKLTKLTGMFWRDSGAIHCSIYKHCIAATIARIWIPNSGHLRSVDMSVIYHSSLTGLVPLMQ